MEEVCDDDLRQVGQLAVRQKALEKEVNRLEELLKSKKKELANVSEVLLPNALAACGMTEFRLASGEMISTKREYYANISKERWNSAEAWLRENGKDGIIKHEVTLSFGKGDDEKAQRSIEVLLQAGFVPEDSKTIHPQTLKAFVKEQLTKGVDIPYDVFGIHSVTKTTVDLTT